MKKSKFSITDLFVLIMIIVTCAFHDNSTAIIITQILGFLFVFLTSIKNNKISISSLLKKYVVYELLFIVYCIVSIIWAYYKESYTSNILSLFQILLLGLTILMYTSTEERFNKIVNYLLIGSLVLCTRLIVQVPLSAWGSDRIGNYIGYGPVGVSFILSYISLFVFHKAIKNKNKINLLLSIILMIVSLLSGSKKAIIISIMFIPLYFMFRSKNIGKFIKNFIFGIVITATILVSTFKIPILYNSVGYRLENMIMYFEGSSMDKSTFVRQELMTDAYRVFKNHPIFGIGIGAFKYTNQYGLYSHNNYLEMLSCLGICGLVLYYWFYIYLIIQSIKLYKKNKNTDFSFIIIVLLIILTMDIASVSYILEPVQISLALICSYFGILSKKEEMIS